MTVFYSMPPRPVHVPLFSFWDWLFVACVVMGFAGLAIMGLAKMGVLGATAPPAALAPNFGLWHGLVIAPEDDCGRPYKRYRKVYDSYERDKGLEDRIVAQQGSIYSPYDGRPFNSIRETDIEHIVARSEAHESGLCRQSKQAKRSFVTDLNNLTLATPDVNRHDKNDKDFGEWQPPMNKCWMAHQVIRVKRLYGLTIDSREQHALQTALCSDPTMVIR